MSSIIVNNNFSYYQGDNFKNVEEHDKPKLKRAGYWIIPPILIDDDKPTKNWVITQATQPWCSGSGTLGDPYIIENVVIDGSGSDICIRIINSNVYFKIRNCTLINGAAGILIENSNYGNLVNNSCSNHIAYGIYIRYNCNNINVTRNVANGNSEYGIYLYAPTTGQACNYIDIWNNTVNSNDKHGIYLYASDGSCRYNNIWNNTVNLNTEHGIYLFRSNDCTISNNKVNFNNKNCIWLDQSDNNDITQNLVKNCSEIGIKLTSSDYNIITKNKVENCTLWDGIEVRWSAGNTISNNNISNNYNSGLRIAENAVNNEVFGNRIMSNKLYGILVDSDCSDTLLYNNILAGNIINGYDQGSNNNWDNGFIGNYWDDYSGVDANDDGIGDSPYDVPPVGGSVDNYPIWEDGDDLAPNIIINSPSMNDAFGFNAPAFNITINDESPINTTWYTIDGGIMNFTFSGLTGTVSQTVWDDKGTELMTLRFYANDSLGHVGFNDVQIWKDLVKPIITINSPVPNQLCGIDGPTFSLTIDEPNLQQKKYSLNGGQNITFTTENRFSQAEWDKVGNGTVLITFYAIDKVGNINSSDVVVRKDAYAPDITIHSPLLNQKFGKNPPGFNISIIEEDLISIWYTVEGIAGTFPVTELTGNNYSGLKFKKFFNDFLLLNICRICRIEIIILLINN